MSVRLIISLWCDTCGVHFMAEEDTVKAARLHARHSGWKHNSGFDTCPDCQPSGMQRVQPDDEIAAGDRFITVGGSSRAVKAVNGSELLVTISRSDGSAYDTWCARNSARNWTRIPIVVPLAAGRVEPQ